MLPGVASDGAQRKRHAVTMLRVLIRHFGNIGEKSSLPVIDFLTVRLLGFLISQHLILKQPRPSGYVLTISFLSPFTHAQTK